MTEVSLLVAARLDTELVQLAVGPCDLFVELLVFGCGGSDVSVEKFLKNELFGPSPLFAGSLELLPLTATGVFEVAEYAQHVGNFFFGWSGHFFLS